MTSYLIMKQVSDKLPHIRAANPTNMLREWGILLFQASSVTVDIRSLPLSTGTAQIRRTDMVRHPPAGDEQTEQIKADAAEGRNTTAGPTGQRSPPQSPAALNSSRRVPRWG